MKHHSCDGCHQMILTTDPYYSCVNGDCSFKLHKFCFELSREITSHPLHPQHTLTLLKKPPSEKSDTCNACKRPIWGLIFRCLECDFQLDLPCASLVHDEGDDLEMKITAPHHGADDDTSHTLICCKIRHNNFRVICSTCDDSIRGLVYVCLKCQLVLDESCADLPVKVVSRFHPRHPLVLDRSIDSCMACLRPTHTSFGYSCANCKFQLDTTCAFLIPKAYDFHPHPLAPVEYLGYRYCGGKYRGDRYIADLHLDCSRCQDTIIGPFLRCIDCDLNLHLHCIPSLPRTFKYERHIHPLTFTESPIKAYDCPDDAEFYCDACEEPRSLPDSTYYCAECDYIAHVPCVIPNDFLLSMGREWPPVDQLQVNSNLTSSELDNEIQHVQTKKEALTAEVKTLTAKREALTAQLEALTAQLEALNQQRALIHQNT